jgi:hypothetical protein
MTRGVIIVAFALGAAAGCASGEGPPPVETTALPRSMTFAVAPVLNYSGQADLDSLKLADLLASELTYVPGAAVLPVSRVAAMLAADGTQQVQSPQHARAIARAAGADALIVAGITEYDAYVPVVGLVVQMYMADGPSSNTVVDIGEARFRASPYCAAARVAPRPSGPAAQVQGTYNAMHKSLQDRLRAYARQRSESDHPDGWRQYLHSQTLFTRFCWNDALRALLDQDAWKYAMVAGPGDEPENYHE